MADVLPGAVLVQVNLSPSDSQSGGKPGDVAFWNCVLRVGGSKDSLVTEKCRAPGAEPKDCKAAFALLHLTPTSSVYLEDVWGWVADHVLDDVAGPGENIAVGRGALIESNGGGGGGGRGTWLVGTSFEHAVLYQYGLRGAKAVYIGMQQTEAPYWQGVGTPVKAPGPWEGEEDGKGWGDPGFGNCKGVGNQEDDERCYRAWGMYMSGSEDVVIHGSALWSFFNGMDDNAFSDPQCMVTDGICQKNMAFVEGAKRTWWFSASSKSAENLIWDETQAGGGGDGNSVAVTTQKDNLGGWGAVVAAYLRNSGDGASGGGGGGGGSSSGSGSVGGGGDGDEGSKGEKRVMVSGIGLAVVAYGILYTLI